MHGINLADVRKNPYRTTRRIGILMCLIPIVTIIYYMIFPVPLEENPWYQMEQEHKKRMLKALEEANKK